jgi:hypothetical protein
MCVCERERDKKIVAACFDVIFVTSLPDLLHLIKSCLSYPIYKKYVTICYSN